MDKFWEWLSGKKVKIAMLISVLTEFTDKVLVNIWGLTAPWVPQTISTLEWFAMMLGIVGLTHQGVKMVAAKNAAADTTAPTQAP